MALLLPMGLKFSRCEITKRRMNTFVGVHMVNKNANLLPGIVEILVIRKVDFILLDGANDTFSIAILPRLTNLGHANSHTSQ